MVHEIPKSPTHGEGGDIDEGRYSGGGGYYKEG
jgi:hypothetical protein